MACWCMAITPARNCSGTGTPNLLADLGIDPDRFRNEFIFDIFIKKVVIGEMSLIEALDRRLPVLGLQGLAHGLRPLLAEP